MKKSEMYKRAQLAVLQATFITDPDKLEIVRELMGGESLARLLEEKDEKGGDNNG